MSHELRIQMVDLHSQHKKLEQEITGALQKVIASSSFIKGAEVALFEENLASYLHCGHVISCANGTDALQMALMALDLEQGDEVILPAFTYVATAEVVALLGLKPVMVDVQEDTFNISPSGLEKALTPRTKVIVPVHLFGLSADMEPLMEFALKNQLWVIEDNAQSLGTYYQFSDGTTKRTGTIGHIGCTSFFPTKNLGCMGDGGAISTNDAGLAEKIRMIANHGQRKKYYHELVGCNSRLDTMQAAILNVKLPHLDEYLLARKTVATFYFQALKTWDLGLLPQQAGTFNQFTLRVKNGRRDQLKDWLIQKKIPSMIYYPLPLYQQKAFKKFSVDGFRLPVTEKLCKSVLSIPIHTEMQPEELHYIARTILNFNPEIS